MCRQCKSNRKTKFSVFLEYWRREEGELWFHIRFSSCFDTLFYLFSFILIFSSFSPFEIPFHNKNSRKVCFPREGKLFKSLCNRVCRQTFHTTQYCLTSYYMKRDSVLETQTFVNIKQYFFWNRTKQNAFVEFIFIPINLSYYNQIVSKKLKMTSGSEICFYESFNDFESNWML